MKKMKKMLSGILATVMSVSMLTAVPVNAENGGYATGDLPAVSDLYYTLDELFAMTDEEFFALEGAENYYGEVKSDTEYFIQIFAITEYGGISGNLDLALDSEDEGVIYTANVTEQQISELLGDTVEYSISSPISLDWDYLEKNNLYYGNRFRMHFPEYELSAERDNITDEDIMEFSKCYYCVRQIIDVYYEDYGACLSSAPSDEKILNGDANLDHAVDLYDVIHIAKYIAMNFEFTELQKIITDMNGDGVVNISDAISVGKQIIE